MNNFSFNVMFCLKTCLFSSVWTLTWLEYLKKLKSHLFGCLRLWRLLFNWRYINIRIHSFVFIERLFHFPPHLSSATVWPREHKKNDKFSNILFCELTTLNNILFTHKFLQSKYLSDRLIASGQNVVLVHARTPSVAVCTESHWWPSQWYSAVDHARL